MNFTFNPANFVSSLEYMGMGMLGIFLVMVIISLIVYCMTKVASKKNQA